MKATLLKFVLYSIFPLVFMGIPDALSAKPSVVQHLSQYWDLTFPKQADFTLSDASPYGPLKLNADSTQCFTLRMTVDTRQCGQDSTVLLCVPGVLTVSLFNAPYSHSFQNYAAFPMSDGTVPVIESEIILHSPLLEEKVRKMKVGVPLGLLNNPKAIHDVVFQFTGTRWTMYVDNRLVDNDFPIGYPAASVSNCWYIAPERVKTASWYAAPITAKLDENAPMPESELMYFVPLSHNGWVGDVVTCFFKGRYHVFYLFDRRNHGSKFVRGAHYFEHLSTADFKTWTEHHTALPIENPYETFGTGTSFVYKGNMYMAYGLHTTRIVPEEKTVLPQQWEFLKDHGYTGSFLCDTIPGLYPAGASFGFWDEARDAFVKSNILFHPCENPSVHVDKQGNLTLLANYHSKGTWVSGELQGGWNCIDENFPPGGDCTFPFQWNDYDYIVGGFCGMWYKHVNEPKYAYKDMAAEGIDFYNGTSVPSMTQLPDGRYLMAGWMGMKRWGGPLLVYEMIQKPDGQIGTRWMKELIPETGAPNDITEEIKSNHAVSTDTRKFMLSFDVVPQKKGKGRLAIQLLGDKNTPVSREWQLSLKHQRAQYGAATEGRFGERERTISEGARPNETTNYAISHLADTDKPFSVRMVVKGTDKLAGSLIDTEISGQRTMIDYQEQLFVSRLKFITEDVEIKNVTIAPLKH